MENIIAELMEYTREKCIDRLYVEANWKERIKDSIINKPVYIFGKGRLGMWAYKQLVQIGVNVAGFLDNSFQNGELESNICPLSCVKADDIVIIACQAYPSIAEQLDNMEVKKHIYYEELVELVDGLHHYSEAYKEWFREIEIEKDSYIRLFNRLGDDASKQILADMLRFRMTYNPKYCDHAMDISLRSGIRDFDYSVTSHFRKGIVFCDVGGYDGDSTLDFMRFSNDYERIYFFEPDSSAYNAAMTRLKEYKNIEFINKGCGSKPGLAKFDVLGGDSGRVSVTGNVEVQVTTLGEFINNSNTYVKMDIEGAELEALQGMSNQIREYKPLLGISVYHRTGDFHVLPEYILSCNEDYSLYLRHYTDNICDTMCYFV